MRPKKTTHSISKAFFIRQIEKWEKSERGSALKVNLRVKLYFICSIYYQRIDCLPAAVAAQLRFCAN